MPAKSKAKPKRGFYPQGGSGPKVAFPAGVDGAALEEAYRYGYELGAQPVEARPAARAAASRSFSKEQMNVFSKGWVKAAGGKLADIKPHWENREAYR